MKTLTDKLLNQTTIYGDKPPALIGASISAYKDSILLFGGRLTTQALTNDIYIFNVPSKTWRKIHAVNAELVKERSFHAALVVDNKLVIMGGQTKTQLDNFMLLNDLCLYDIDKNSWEVHKFDKSVIQERYAHLIALHNDKLVILGGQDLQNEYIKELLVVDLASKIVEKRNIEYNFGAYRSCLINYLDGFFVFSNSKFTDVQRDFFYIDKDYNIILSNEDIKSAELPPGLRFPESFKLGDNMIVGGIYISNKTQSYAVWSFNIKLREWKRIEPQLVAKSWNKSVLVQGDLIVFGNSFRELLHDYNERRLNFDELVKLNLEVYNIFEPPSLITNNSAIDLGLTILSKSNFSDFSFHSKDGYRIDINSGILEMRWPSYTRQLGRGVTNKLYINESHDLIRFFVKFLYTDTLEFNSETENVDFLGKLLLFSNNYAVKRLNDLIAMKLHQMLNVDNAVQIFHYASSSNREGLKLRSLQLLIQEKHQLFKYKQPFSLFNPMLKEEFLSYFPQESRSDIESNELQTDAQSFISNRRPSLNSEMGSIASDKSIGSINKKSSIFKFSGGRRPSIANLFSFGEKKKEEQSKSKLSN